MPPISIVIITKNEAGVIVDCVKAAKLISDDVIIMDNGSTDGTQALARTQGCSVHDVNWAGYGANKNEGVALAKNDWIFSLDADEVADAELINSLQQIKFDSPQTVYDIKYHSYFGKKRIKFGFWGRDHHIRIFNRKVVRWSDSKVHETLLLPKQVKIKKIKGHLQHYSVCDKNECIAKAIHYARLSAENYFQEGKKPGFIKLYISPYFSFFINYIIFLGILDGGEGLQISKTIFKNKWLKYRFLKMKISGKIDMTSARPLPAINRLSVRNG
jgi:glycosyltransferase involved in cell wall biosynthesis